MSPVRIVVSLLAATLLMAPSAIAASARGEFETTGISFPAEASLSSAGLSLLHEGEAIPVFELDGLEITVHRLGESRVRVPGVYEFRQSEINEKGSYSEARLTLLQGGGSQLVALRSLGPASARIGPATMLPVEGAQLASVLDRSCEDAVDTYGYCLEVRGVYELVGQANASLSGEVIFLLYGPTLRVATGAETFDYTSGAVTESDGVRGEDAWVVVRARSAVVTLGSESARFYSTAPTIQSTVTQLTDASGRMSVGARQYSATSDDVLAKGALLITPGAVAPAQGNGVALAPVYASSFTTQISGDVASINLNSQAAFLDSTAERVGFAAVLALLVAGAAYAWQHISFFAAAMYTRLSKPDILDNDVRSRIYDIIRENPGISAREVHRRSEQSWGTVVYHLRQLERHHLVVSRALGRTRNYYENHGKYRGMEVQLACLQSDRARVLARAIAGTPGITQEQLALASGFPQPTTSYYVRKLKQAGLVVEQREGRYVKYVPHADLPRFIAMSEQPVVATAPSGVQA